MCWLRQAQSKWSSVALTTLSKILGEGGGWELSSNSPRVNIAGTCATALHRGTEQTYHKDFGQIMWKRKKGK